LGATGLVAQSIRLNTTASNLANADSVSGPDGKPYRSRQVVFTATQQPGSPGNGVAVTEIIESTPEQWVELVETRVQLGLSQRDAIAEVAKELHVPKRDVYDAVLANNKRGN